MSSWGRGSAMSPQLLRLARLLLLLEVLCVRPTASLTMTACSAGFGIVAPSPYTVYYKESSYCQLLYYSGYSSSYVNWYDANTACGQLSGGTLATVDNADVNALVTGVSGGTSAWIGLYDTSSERTWAWADGTPYSYNSWGTIEPNNWLGQDEDCVMTNWAGDGLWNDFQCR